MIFVMHKVQREITQKIYKAELPFLHSARHLMLIDICIKFREYSLSGFQVIERTRFVTDRQTDRQTNRRGKTICLPTLKGGDIITSQEFAIFTRGYKGHHYVTIVAVYRFYCMALYHSQMDIM